MDHCYIISNSTENYVFSQPFINDHIKNINIIHCPDQKSESKLTHEIYKHLNSITHLSIDKFDWQYYCNKYSDLSKVKKQQPAWENWLKCGLKESRNPIDRRTISSSYDVNLILAMMTICLYASKHNHRKILVVNNLQKCVQFTDFSRIFENYKDVVTNKKLCIISYMQINYAYIIDISIFSLLLAEMSLFVNKFDDIIRLFINTYCDDYQIFNHSDTNFNDKLVPLSNVNKINIDCHVLSKEIPNIKTRYFQEQYDHFLKTYELTKTHIDNINYILCKVSYDKAMSQYNSYLSMHFYNYLNLCLSIINGKFIKAFNIRQISNEIPDLATIYFDHEFYLQLYPCYTSIFKNPAESYMHYINHGTNEKLICNPLIFDIIKNNQDYHLQQYISKFDSQINYDQSLILYNTALSTYYLDNKPLIYIITRTSNRESLFYDCCESIRKQAYVNVRHIVSFDSTIAEQYVKKMSTGIFKTVNLIADRSKLHPNQYVDRIYDTISKYEPGWVLILDDDDQFMTKNALYSLEKYLINPDNLIIWMLYRPDKFIYPANKNNPVVGEIGSCCYIYHTSRIKKGIWGGNSIGDYQFFKYLFEATNNHIYIDYPLTGINYSEKVSGWSAM